MSCNMLFSILCSLSFVYHSLSLTLFHFVVWQVPTLINHEHLYAPTLLSTLPFLREANLYPWGNTYDYVAIDMVSSLGTQLTSMGRASLGKRLPVSFQWCSKWFKQVWKLLMACSDGFWVIGWVWFIHSAYYFSCNNWLFITALHSKAQSIAQV